MIVRLSRAAVALVAVATAVACSKSSPTQPTPAAPTAAAVANAASTASVTVPRPVTPTNNAQIKFLDQPVTLTVINAVTTKTDPLTYTIEIATDAAFGNKVQTKDGVAEGSSGQTSVRLDALAGATDYFWHGRATGGGTVGPFGAVYKFTIGPQITINAPAPVQPLTGAQTVARPTFSVTNAVRQGPAGPITYRFDIARDAAFTSLVATSTVTEGSGRTSYTPASDLPAQTTLYWRATAIDASDAISSTASATQSFTTSLAIDLTKVVYLRSPDVSAWPRTANLTLVEQDGNAATGGLMCMSFTDPGWPDSPWPYGGSDPNFGVYANQWYFANIGGTWYAGAGEWMYRGAAVCKAGQGTYTIGPDSGFGPPFSTWVPKPGEMVGFMVSSVARAGAVKRTVDERSNVIVQPWHDSSLQGFSTAAVRFKR